jgi:hypothetical protein
MVLREENRNESVAVDTNPVTVCEAIMPPSVRKAIVLVNTSTGGQIITVAFGTEAALGKGIVLAGYGEWSETLDARFTPSQAQVRAISSLAGGTLGIHERIVTEE